MEELMQMDLLEFLRNSILVIILVMVALIAGAVALLGAMASSEPSKALPWHPRPAPRGGELVRDTMLRRGQRLLTLGRDLRPAVSDPRRSARAIGNGISALWSLVASGIERPHAPPFNGTVGPSRRTA